MERMLKQYNIIIKNNTILLKYNNNNISNKNKQPW